MARTATHRTSVFVFVLRLERRDVFLADFLRLRLVGMFFAHEKVRLGDHKENRAVDAINDREALGVVPGNIDLQLHLVLDLAFDETAGDYRKAVWPRQFASPR